jgi:hypothetical protein
MAKTSEQMIANQARHAERSSRGVAAARASGNYQLAAFNVRQGFNAFLMQGLIGWRTGVVSPAKALKEAVQLVCDGIESLKVLTFVDSTKDVPAERASIISFLIDAHAADYTVTELISDRLLDAVLAGRLRSEWDESAWDKGIDELRKIKGSDLAIESYLTYRRILDAQQVDAKRVIEGAIRLFEKRAEDAFFGGGDQTEGGGPDNAITVDYRLAAIMKKVGCAAENVHLWRW